MEDVLGLLGVVAIAGSHGDFAVVGSGCRGCPMMDLYSGRFGDAVHISGNSACAIWPGWRCEQLFKVAASLGKHTCKGRGGVGLY